MDFIVIIIIGFIAYFIIHQIVPTKGVNQITTSELKNEMGSKNKLYIDVRSPREFLGNHIKGFQNIPLVQLSEKLNIPTKDKEIIVICQSGMRSNKACKILKRKGFTKITNVIGGMNNWS